MEKIKSSLNKAKVWTVKKALDKGETLDEKYTWTIYFLVDLKIVYIITYAYITIVNLISSTANSEATSDAGGTMLFNVTVSPEHRNVGVDSISDAILWNCRRESMTNYYYRFLYWMLIIAMSAALFGFLVTKFIALITVSCNCTCGSFNKYRYDLTKLWHIAILKQLKERTKPNSEPPQSATGNENPSEHDEENDHLKDGAKPNSPSPQSATGNENPSEHGEEKNNHTQPDHSKSLKFDLKEYQPLLDEDVTKVQGVCISSRTNYCRLALPGILLFLSVTIMGLSYLSYDLHPLACIRQSEEEFIKYNATSKRVELKFSDALTDFQKAVGIIVFVLSVLFLALALLFYHLSKCIIHDLNEEAGKHIDEVERLILLKKQDHTHCYI